MKHCAAIAILLLQITLPAQTPNAQTPNAQTPNAQTPNAQTQDIRASDTQAQNVIVRTSRQPDGPVMLGQSVRLLVDVLFPDGMPHPPRVDPPRVAGAQVFRFEGQATTMEDRIGNAPITGQRFEFDLYARRAGTLAVPAVEVTLLDQAGNPISTRTGTPQTVQAIVPPG
jgi:hypothetical protein